MRILALLSMFSIASAGLMGCHYHDDDDRHEHAAYRDRDRDHVVREERTIVVPEHRTETDVHIER